MPEPRQDAAPRIPRADAVRYSCLLPDFSVVLCTIFG